MDLVCKLDFNLTDAFNIFDIERNGYITQKRFQEKVKQMAPEIIINLIDV